MKATSIILSTLTISFIAFPALANGTADVLSSIDLAKIKTSIAEVDGSELIVSRRYDISPKDEKPVVSGGYFTPWNGVAVEKLFVIEGGIRLEKYWKELTPDQWRNELQNQFSQTIIYDAKLGTSVNLPVGAAFSVGRGEFRLNYHNFRYKSYPCHQDNPHIGSILVGVGVRINIDTKFRSGSFTLGLTNLALSASKNKVIGVVQGDTVGLGNSNTLAQVVGAMSGQLTYERLVEASKAYAVANQALENMIDLTNPQVFGFVDNLTPGKCQKALLGG